MIARELVWGQRHRRIRTIPVNESIIFLRRGSDQVPPKANRNFHLPSSALSVVLTCSCYCGVRSKTGLGVKNVCFVPRIRLDFWLPQSRCYQHQPQTWDKIPKDRIPILLPFGMWSIKQTNKTKHMASRSTSCENIAMCRCYSRTSGAKVQLVVYL